MSVACPGKRRNAAAIFSRLAGHWRQARMIAPGGIYRGEASFQVRDAHWLDYSEQGEITLPDRRQLQATQRYLFALEGHSISVYFNEAPPRLFHRLNFAGHVVDGAAIAVASHQCGADFYQSTYKIHSADRFVIVHEVNGPRKAYVMTTDYCRIA